MSVPVNSNLTPRTVGYALVEDTDVKGSFHTVDTNADRDAIPDYVRKAGMFVYVIDTTGLSGPSVLYQLGNNLLTWTVFASSGSGASSGYLWSSGKTWATLWGEIQAGGGFGTVYVPPRSSVTVTGVGPYDLNDIKFVGLGNISDLNFDPGVLVDAGANVSLTFENLSIFGQAPMITPGSKVVELSLHRCYLSNYGGGAALFSTSATGNRIWLYDSSLRNENGTPTDAILNLTDPAARLTVVTSGGGFSGQWPPLSSDDLFIGNASAIVNIVTDALGNYDWSLGVNGPVASSLSSQFGRLGLPNYTTVALPTPTSLRKGQVAFDTTATKPKVCDGSSWLELATGSLSVERKANASDTLLTTTGATSVVTYTPASQGNYLLHIYYRVVTASTDLTLTVTWTDGSGAQTETILNVSSQAIGSYMVAPTFINATAAAITVTATAGTANQVYVSSNIVSV
jgi:hypothetical protein